MNADETLIEKLFSVGERLPERVKDEIVARGASVLPHLRRLVDNDALFDADARGKGWAPLHAVTLLGKMQATECITRLITLLSSSYCDEYVWDRSLQALQAMGAAALEPCLAAHDATDDDEVRSSLAAVLCELGVKDERVYALLVARLDREVGISASNLVSYGDARALPHLATALDQYALEPDDDNPFVGQDVLELCDAIERLGGTLTEGQRRKEQRVSILRRRFQHSPMKTDAPDEPPPGRNDPCWCGSGTKYKKCHLAADDAARLDNLD